MCLRVATIRHRFGYHVVCHRVGYHVVCHRFGYHVVCHVVCHMCRRLVIRGLNTF